MYYENLPNRDLANWLFTEFTIRQSLFALVTEWLDK